jgi:hypothetical protein
MYGRERELRTIIRSSSNSMDRLSESTVNTSKDVTHPPLKIFDHFESYYVSVISESHLVRTYQL